MRLGAVGQLAAGLPLQPGKDQPRERIEGAAAEVVGVRMARGHEQFVDRRVHRREVALDLHPQHLRPLAAIDRQDAVRRDLAKFFAVVEVIAEGLDPLFVEAFLLQLLLAQSRRRLARPCPPGLCRRRRRAAFPLPSRMRAAASGGTAEWPIRSSSEQIAASSEDRCCRIKRRWVRRGRETSQASNVD